MNERFYFVGDWIDEFCDLTLDKFVETLSKNDNTKNYVHELVLPEDIETLKKELIQLEDKNSMWVHVSNKTLLQKLKALFKKG